MKPKIVILTGPAGAGKSTVGKILANKLENSVVVSTDELRHFVKRGYVVPWQKEGRFQLNLGAENACLLAKNFYKNGFNVFLDDVICLEERMNIYKKLLKKEKPIFIVLLPAKDVLSKRDLERGEWAMKEKALRHHDLFSEFIKKEKKLIVIDSSQQTPEETTNIIMEKLTWSKT